MFNSGLLEDSSQTGKSPKKAQEDSQKEDSQANQSSTLFEEIPPAGETPPAEENPSETVSFGMTDLEFFQALVLRHFPYGITPSSIIDRKKFFKVWEEFCGSPFCNEKTIPNGYISKRNTSPENISFDSTSVSNETEALSDQAKIRDQAKQIKLTALATESCVRLGNKYYPIPILAQQFLKKLCTELQDYNTLYFDCLYRENSAQFRAVGIASPEILAEAMRKFCTENLDAPSEQASIVIKDGDTQGRNKSFFVFREDQSLEDEMLSHFENSVLTFQELASQLPYVPEEVLRESLKSPKILNCGAENYAKLESLAFDEQEFQTAIQRIQNDIQKNGYALVNQISLSNTQESYDGIPKLTLLKALLLRSGLMETCSLQSGIISKKDSKVSIRKLLLDFCQNRQICSLEELKEFYQSQTELSRPELALRIAQAILIQLDKNIFVHPEKIHFDVEETDKVLAEITGGKPTPLLDFTNFSLFPAVLDFSWNRYLLMSYALLVSKKFTLLRPAVNNPCIGLLCPVHGKKHFPDSRYTVEDYYNFAAQMALADGIDLNFDAIADYAIQRGLLATRQKTSLESFFNAMKALQGQI